MIKILRGDDSSAVRITPTVPDGLDLAGAKLVFECGGLVFEFADFLDAVSFTFPRSWTASQPVGRQLGRWSLVWPGGRRVTTTNTFPVYLTDNVSDVGGESRADIALPGSPLEGLTLDPNASSASILTILAAAFRRLGGTVAAPVVAVLIGLAALSASAVHVTVKQPGEFRPNVDPVVTDVDLSDIAPGNYAAVSNAAMTAAQNAANYTDSATNNLIYQLTHYIPDEVGISVAHADYSSHSGEADSAFSASSATSAESASVAGSADFASNAEYAFYLDTTLGDERSASTIFSQLDAATATNAQQSSILADIAASVGTNSANVATLGTQVAAIGAHLGAEDAHFVSTNYDSAVRLPEAYVEIKMRDQATGSNTWITIWQEMRRWTAFVGSAFDWQTWQGFHAWATNITHELSFKADRCWGIYDSETGGYSPEGFTQISSSNILIAAGMAYQRTITSGGAVWVLQCNQGVAHIGGDTNGFFRVIDSDGNTQFEIVKGDRREVGANASGITVNNGTSPPTVIIPYSIEAGEHPTLQICDDLITADWKSDDDPDCLATVEWTGTSGAYVATVQRKAAGDALFVRATYMAGGETYIKNVAPISVGGGIFCTDGIHKVRPVYNNGTITWQVVQ